MLEFFRRHKHLYAIIAPSLICLAMIAFTIPTLTGPIKFFEADYILVLTGGQPIFGLRIIPVLVVYLLILFVFFFTKRWGIKVATIAALIVATILTITYKISFLPSIQETSLSDIVSTVEQLTEDNLPLVATANIPKAINFYTDCVELDSLTAAGANATQFWYVLDIKEGEIELESYQIAGEVSNKYYHAVRFERSKN